MLIVSNMIKSRVYTLDSHFPPQYLTQNFEGVSTLLLRMTPAGHLIYSRRKEFNTLLLRMTPAGHSIYVCCKEFNTLLLHMTPAGHLIPLHCKEFNTLSLRVTPSGHLIYLRHKEFNTLLVAIYFCNSSRHISIFIFDVHTDISSVQGS